MERYTKESLPKEMQCKSGLYDLSSFYHVKSGLFSKVAQNVL